MATLTTIAGGTGWGPATSVSQSPYFIAVNGSKLVLSDLVGNALRSVDLASGMESTVAGTGFGGFDGDGQAATSAEVNQPAGVVVDAAGDIFFADQSNARIREIPARDGTYFGIPMKAGYVYTVAGDGVVGFAGDGGPAVSAEISLPEGLAVDGQGNLFFADTQNGRIRMVPAVSGTYFGIAMKSGDIYTVAGDGQGGATAYSGDGGPALDAGLGTPQGVALDAQDDLLVTQDFGETSAPVRMVAAHAIEFMGIQMAPGDIYTVAGSLIGQRECGGPGAVGDGGPALGAILCDPVDVAWAPSGNFYVSDYYDNRVREVNVANGYIETVVGTGQPGFAGDGGPATAAQLALPTGLALDSQGDLFVSDSSTVREVAAASGEIITVAGNGTFSFSGDGGPAIRAQLGAPSGVAIDGHGNLFLADAVNNVVRMVAGQTGTFFGIQMTEGYMYTIAGRGGGVGGIFGLGGYAGDGGPAVDALLSRPLGVAVDSVGNVYVMDSGNARVRVIAATNETLFGIQMTAGYIYTIVGNGEDVSSGDGGPALQAGILAGGAVATDSAGDLFFSETADAKVREVAAHSGNQFGRNMVAGDVYTVAGNGTVGSLRLGGPAVESSLDGVGGIALDGHGNLFVSCPSGNVVVEVAAATTPRQTAGFLYGFAGDGTAGFGGDGGPAGAAELDGPTGLAVDGSGDLFVADSGNHRIREVSQQGVISTVAGDGTAGFAGDGGPAGAAELADLAGLALDSTGDVVAAEFYSVQGFAYPDANGRIVKVAFAATGIPPSPPLSVTVEPGRLSLTVRWLPPVSDGGSPVSFYTVFEQPFNVSRSVPATANSVVIGAADPSVQYSFTVVAINAIGASVPSAPSSPGSPLPAPDGHGYTLFAASCAPVDFGSATVPETWPLVCGDSDPAVAAAVTPDGGGYWETDANGYITTLGDANFYGSAGNLPLVKPIVSIAATPDGGGYWLAASDGGVFAFGDANFYGSATGTGQRYVAIATG